MSSLAVIGLLASAVAVVANDYPINDALAACPGYKASNTKIGQSGLTADLTLAGPPCNIYGTDLTDLVLEVSYETGKKIGPCQRPT